MLSKRQETLLNFVIKEYIRTAKPVPSSLAAGKTKLKVSPATIRNEMNDLEAQGYLDQLHTSGGRVPTDKAYRHYVDNLLAGEEPVPNAPSQKVITHAIKAAGDDPRAINKCVARVLSELSENLVITGIDPAHARMGGAGETDFFKVGLSSLLSLPEFREFDRVFQLASFFEEFDHMFERFHQEVLQSFSLPVTRMNIFIGRENPFSQVRDETVMVAKYPLPGNCTGSLALIGPTRMDYGKNIALIKFTAEILGGLKHRPETYPGEQQIKKLTENNHDQ